MRQSWVVGGALALSWAGPAAGADLFVDAQSGTCSDAATRTEASSEATPVCTMQAGADLAEPGDVVRVKAGTYAQSAFLDIERGGAQGNPVTFRPHGDGPVAIVGPANDRAVGIYVDHVVFEGFEIRDCGETGLRNGGSYVTLRGNVVHDCGRGCDSSTKCGQGIGSNSATSVGVVIENNLSYRNGSGYSLDHCYYISGREVIVRNNIAADCAGWGFQIYPDCDGCDVYNNVAYGNVHQSGFVLGGEESSGTVSEGMRVYNNIAVDNGKYGFLVYENGSGGIDLTQNLAYGNPDGAVGATNPNIAHTVTGTVEADPRLVDPEGLDFHIADGSPAIDAGSAALVAPFDLDGQARPIGPAVDIGADEWGDAPGSGSATSGSGGAGAGGGGAGGAASIVSGGDGAGDSSGSGGGCGCRATPAPTRTGLLVTTLTGLWVLLRRRRGPVRPRARGDSRRRRTH